MRNRTTRVRGGSAIGVGLRTLRALVALLAAVAAVTLAAQESPRSGAAASAAPPALEKHVIPTYPWIARAAMIQGTVTVEVGIDLDGRVTESRVFRSIPLLDAAAVEAVRQWRFGRRDAGGVLKRTITFVFELDSGSRPRRVGYSPPLPSWMPSDFGWTYGYACRGTSIWVDSIGRSVFTRPASIVATTLDSFSFEAADAIESFMMMVKGGVFDPGVSQQSWKEGESEPSVREVSGGISMTIRAIGIMSKYESNPSYVAGKGRPGLHALAVRRGRTWQMVTWEEPVRKNSAPTVSELSDLGRRLREFVHTRLSDPREVPVC